MNTDVNIPPWLRDVFLGYGDPSKCTRKHMTADDLLLDLDMYDTFVDARHVEESFPGQKVEFAPPPTRDDGTVAAIQPPFRLKFPPTNQVFYLLLVCVCVFVLCCALTEW